VQQHAADLTRSAEEHWGRLLALLAAELRDFDLAEDCLAEAFAVAVSSWSTGRPVNPPAWLLTVARNAARDQLRRSATLRRKLPLLLVDAPGVAAQPGPEESMSQEAGIPDERLRLVCTCCHPALSTEAAIALTLRLVLGLSTAQIARLFVLPEATMAARLTRAKKKIRAAGIPYRVPASEDLLARTARICRVAYLLFTEGYAATDGPDLVRTALADEAIRLARIVKALVPDDAEVSALLALMLLQHARREARTEGGELVLLPDQDRRRWMHDEVAEGLQLLSDRTGPSGGFALQAAIAAQHMSAGSAGETDWARIAALYQQLEQLTGSAVVRLNRAVAVAEAEGAHAGLAVLQGCDDRLSGHHLLAATRAELLRRLGRVGSAREEYLRALALVGTDPERRFLERQLARLDEHIDLPDRGIQSPTSAAVPEVI